jgi:DNA (cytosine-5)-methyltransferase 3A
MLNQLPMSNRITEAQKMHQRPPFGNTLLSEDAFTVLSLFDGMSCGQLALQRAGFNVSKYYACEIDKYAIQVTQKNFPNTIQLGDVTKVNARDLSKVNLLIGGSPCQGFSFAGKQLNFDDPRSKLFFEFVRLKNECNPKYFLLENVPMKKEFEQVITEYLQVEPLRINSNVFSAQDRKRVYWTNLPLNKVPDACYIYIKDIVGFESDIPCENDVIDEVKKYTSRDFQISISKKGRIRPHRFDAKKSGISEVGTLVNPSDKCVTIIASHTPKTYKTNPFEIYELNRNECEAIQGVPNNYTLPVSERQAKKMLGNGWNVNTIAHIFGGLS